MMSRTGVPTETDHARARELSAAGPWIDVHAHPGRCFLGGLPPGSPIAELLGEESSLRSVGEIVASGVSTVAFATVGDLAVLSLGPAGLRAGRGFGPGEAGADHDRQLGALGSLVADPRVVLVRHVDDIRRAHREGRAGVIMTCEGADFLDGDLAGLSAAHAHGVRAVTLVHYRVNELGDIQTEPVEHGGLTSFGAEVVDEMNGLGMVIDLAHATHRVTLDVIERSSAPVVVSHSHLGDGAESHPRLLSEDHARDIASAGGLIGAWPAGVVATDLAGYVTQILRLVELVGVDHVAIGTDMDANYRPVLTSYGQFYDVAAHLLASGMVAAEVNAVMGANFVRVFGEVCG